MEKYNKIFVNTPEPAESYTHTHTHTHTHTGKPCQVKKQIGTICLMLISFFISPTFATEINNPATCDSGTLSTDTGPTNLRANYESNTLNLRFYDNNTLLDVSSTNSGTCTYGTPINLPTPPTKRGYTFKGWKVIPEYDFTTLNETITSSAAYSKGANGGCMNLDFVIVDCNSHYSDLNNNEWKARYSYGTVYGTSWCSTTTNPGGGSATTINQSEYGGNCWCRVTGYIPNGSSVKYAPTTPTKWFIQNIYSVDVCESTCAMHCAPTYSTVWRSKLFGKS